MKMRPTKLQIIGNPNGGTPVMLAAPSIAIDLPPLRPSWNVYRSVTNGPELLLTNPHISSPEEPVQIARMSLEVLEKN